jgi:hypothetical protein
MDWQFLCSQAGSPQKGEPLSIFTLANFGFEQQSPTISPERFKHRLAIEKSNRLKCYRKIVTNDTGIQLNRCLPGYQLTINLHRLLRSAKPLPRSLKQH